MLKLKKLNTIAFTVLALSPALMTTLQLRAEDAPAPEAPTPVLVRGLEISLTSEADIEKYFPGLWVKEVADNTGVHLEYAGFVHKDCKKYLRIDLETATDNTHPGTYALHISRADTKIKGTNTVVEDSAVKCADLSAACQRDNPDCEDLATSGVLSRNAKQTFPNMGGLYRLREENNKVPLGTPGAVKFEKQLPVKFGNLAQYLTPKEKADAKEKADRERHATELKDACEAAYKDGLITSVGGFVEGMSDDEAKSNQAVIIALYENAFDLGLEDAKTVADLKKYVAELKRFYEALTKDRPKRKLRDALEDSIARHMVTAGKKIAELPVAGETRDANIARAQDARKAATDCRDIIPGNQLCRLADAGASYKLGVMSLPFDPVTGQPNPAYSPNDPQFNYQTSQNLLQNAYKVGNWAYAANDPAVSAMATQYQQAAQGAQQQLQPRYVYQETPQGRIPVGYGTGYDQDYVNYQTQKFMQSQQRSPGNAMNDRMNAYVNSMRNSPIGNPYNTTPPANGVQGGAQF